MQARFLLGPAGSGKSFRCIGELRAELLADPAGPPLIFLAPKQATFQIERQLLGAVPVGNGPALTGYSRLQILSFERLAAFVLAQSGQLFPDTLTEEGRVMVLRALLARHHAELRVFRATARLTGFATQLSTLLRELQCGRVSASVLQTLAGRLAGPGQLPDKLHDLALLLTRYDEWLAARRAQGVRLDDATRLLDLAAAALRERATRGARLPIAGLWLDGFAEMTPQEVELLAALVPHCRRATMAFCLDAELREPARWLSPWAVVGRTFLNCRAAVAKSLGTAPTIETIQREASRSRFSAAPALFELECAWVSGSFSSSKSPAKIEGENEGEDDSSSCSSAIRLVACPNAEAEATLAAREIRQHVLNGGRYRDCAILVRSLDGYHDVLRRTLRRYDIPFFLDRREPVAHHPLAELTRYALRTVAFDWRHEDWFGALKSGLAGAHDAEVDELENEALKHGWEGRVWREPFLVAGVVPPERASSGSTSAPTHQLELLRQRVVRPFTHFAEALGSAQFQPDGVALAEAISGLWCELNVEATLERWNESAQQLDISGSAHATVWGQLTEWVASLERAFAGVPLSLREWLPIVEAGFAGMTVGVIPPSLDQVLVGSVDRSRNPDLQKVFVLGVSEGVFPAPPTPAVLLTDSDRLELEAHGVAPGATARSQLGHERYFGYIAFTRARQQLVVTWAEADEDGKPLNASSFVGSIQAALPEVQREMFVEADWRGAVHREEWMRHVALRCSSAVSAFAGSPIAAPEIGGTHTSPRASPHLAPPPLPNAEKEKYSPLLDETELCGRLERTRQALQSAALAPATAARLYSDQLKTSVSALEEFAACPFRFLAARGLRIEERDEFVVDARQRGSFQHEVLQKFHERVRAKNLRWREVPVAQARQWLREVGEECARQFEGGLLQADEARRFEAAVMLSNLEQLVGTLVEWARHNAFEPAEVEVNFGLPPDEKLPAWNVTLPNGRTLRLRGRIDRIDVCRLDDGRALVVICDYKSSAREMDPVKVEAGLELQLLSYLAALAQMPEARGFLGAKELVPAGVFYIPLRPKLESARTRTEPPADEVGNAGNAASFQHRGRFDAEWLAQFDARGLTKGEQFRFKLKQDGTLAAVGNDALPAPKFPQLVQAAEARLREIGERIYSGEATVSPFRHKQQTACDLCPYRAGCRFDPWVTSFRTLKGGEVED